MSKREFSRELRDQELRDTARNLVIEYRMKTTSQVTKAIRAAGIQLSEAYTASLLESIGAYKDKDGYFTIGSGFTSPYTTLTDSDAVLNEVRRALRAFVYDCRIHRDRLYFRSVPDSGPILQRWLGMLDWPEVLMTYGGQHGAVMDCVSDEAALYVRTRLYGGKQEGAPNSWSRPSLTEDKPLMRLTKHERQARMRNEEAALNGEALPYPEYWDEEAKRSLAETREHGNS